MVKPFLSENACFFNFFSTIKVKLVNEMMQSAYLCVILFTDKSGDFGAIFVTERNCATPISKVKSRISVHTVISDKGVCQLTVQFRSVVCRSLSTVSAFSQFFPSSTVVWKFCNFL